MEVGKLQTSFLPGMEVEISTLWGFFLYFSRNVEYKYPSSLLTLLRPPPYQLTCCPAGTPQSVRVRMLRRGHGLR